MASGLPSGWTQHVDAGSGKTFYHNASTGATSWEMPQMPQQDALPAGWTEHVDPGSGRSYYYNAATGQTAWERPQGGQPASAQPQAQAQQASLPEGWTEHVDPGSGKTFYFNAATQVTSWERPAAPQASAALPQAAAAPSLGEPLQSINAFLDEAKAVQTEVSAYKEQIVQAMLEKHAASLKQNATQTFSAISAAANVLLPKAQEQAALPMDIVGNLNTAVQAFEHRYGCTESEMISTQLVLAKPGGRQYPNLVQKVEAICNRTLDELEAREAAAFKAQMLRGGVDETLDSQIKEGDTRLTQSLLHLRAKYIEKLGESDHQPVCKTLGSGEAALTVMCWNIMEFPRSSQTLGRELVVEGLLPFCERITKELKREDDRQLLVDAMSAPDVVQAHAAAVTAKIISAIEERKVRAVMLQGLNSEVKDRIADVCRGKNWHTCFAGGGDAEKCESITGIISDRDFAEEEGGGIEIQEGKTTRHFAAARQAQTWFVSCHVPPPTMDRDAAKQDAGAKVAQKLAQELHRKDMRIIAGGDWNADVNLISKKVSSHMPYGCARVSAHEDGNTCFGIDCPVDGFLEIA